MSNTKKTLNILGIIFASILSIVLVIVLAVSPIFFSALSLLKPQSIAKAITSVDYTELITQDSQQNESTPEASNKNKGEQEIKALLKSDAAKEIVELCVRDFSNAFVDESKEKLLSVEKFKEITDKNITEIAETLKNSNTEYSVLADDALVKEVKKVLDDNAQKIVNAIPSPAQIKEQIKTQNPELDAAFTLMAQSGKIRLIAVGLIILISAIIFVCRLFDFRGFKWLSIAMFVSGGIAGIVSVAILLNSSLIDELAASSGTLGGIVEQFASAFTSGTLIRTAVMLICAAALIVAYVFIKKAKNKNLQTEENE